jgi:cell division protein FtsL
MSGGHLKYMPRKQIDNRALRRRSSPRAIRRFTIVFLLGCLLVLGMIFSGWVRWKQREIMFRANQLRSQKEDLEEQRKRLLMELSRLRSLEKVAREARSGLGMEEAEPAQVILVAEEAAGDASGEQGTGGRR